MEPRANHHRGNRRTKGQRGRLGRYQHEIAHTGQGGPVLWKYSEPVEEAMSGLCKGAVSPAMKMEAGLTG